MRARKFLAVPRDEPENYYIEDSPEAVNYALANEVAIDYYPIYLDPLNEPTVGRVAMLGPSGEVLVEAQHAGR